ncbi:MAG: hypothetical protein Q7S95_03765 [bacterium]|nr:hypothetical protein [bacterium]
MVRSHTFAPGVYAHICNRGVRKMPIRREENDFWRLLFNLFYFNHTDRVPEHWRRDLEHLGGPAQFIWPEAWGEREPLVAILAFDLMPNHLHLMLKELVEGGISKFAHRVLMGYAKFINEKYDESGSLFQGPFRSRLVIDDTDFRNLAVYVMVKNPFELYPGGLKNAIENFDDAYERAIKSPFNSLADYAGKRESQIIDKDLLGELFETPDSFKEFARETMLNKLDELEALSQEFGF